MNENGNKRREWVKNAAIIFLTVMLLLTFFSNTIMNYSLPEVAVKYVQSGSITAQIRGTGTVESDDPYEIKVNETRKVESVLVREGDVVQKGDPLFLMSEKESTELEAVKNELKTREEALETAKDSLNAKYDELSSAMISLQKEILGLSDTTHSQEAIQNAQNGVSASMAEYQSRIDAADAEVAKYQKAVDDLNLQISQLDTLNNQLNYAFPDTNEQQDRLNKAERELNADPVKNALDKISQYNERIAEYEATIAERNEGRIVGWQEVSGGDAIPIYSVSDEDFELAKANLDRYNELKREQQKIVDNKEAKEAYDKKYKEYSDAVKALEDARNSVENHKNSIAVNISNMRLELDEKNKALEDAREAKAQLLADISWEMDMSDPTRGMNAIRKEIANLREDVAQRQEEVSEQMEVVRKEEENALGLTIEAPISGTISNINIVAGNDTTAGSAIATMLPEGAGFTMSFSVTNDQARQLNPGIQADLVNSWRYGDMTITLSAIRPDPQNPSTNRLLVFDVEGDVTAGQSLSVSVGDRSANYDMVVPNSAIREDSNGTFVLQVESKSSPLGTRYTAVRVDVEVVASDDTQSAVTGALYTYSSYVITTSDKPVTAGQLVRLADN